jgi:hypothetical protein
MDVTRLENDIFAFIISFINALWQPCHIMVGLFTLESTVGAMMAEQMKTLLRESRLFNKVVAFVKDEGVNLPKMITTLKNIVSCHILICKLHLHVMSKVV